MQRRNLIRGKFFSHSEDVRLPWLKSAALFYKNCTQCAECIRACPERIVKKADGGYPAIDFKFGECTFCGECAQACPQELFETHINRKSWAFIAKVEQACLTLHQVSCRSCQDSCAYGAIKFELVLGMIPRPEINDQLCTGCGACVAPCPSFAIEIVTNKNMKLSERSINVYQY
ncbi:MAG: ferredoxin-type protein NapF [Gammaproteobacteria bacterium]|nr:ferredoxin-type protein NapF [Gammaproteobacteria bacterium]